MEKSSPSIYRDVHGLDYHNEVKISFEILIFYSFDKKKFWIFQGLIQGPLDPKLLTLPLDHEVTSEDRKNHFKNSKVVDFEAIFWEILYSKKV